jgi:hypothetical protein
MAPPDPAATTGSAAGEAAPVLTTETVVEVPTALELTWKVAIATGPSGMLLVFNPAAIHVISPLPASRHQTDLPDPAAALPGSTLTLLNCDRE